MKKILLILAIISCSLLRAAGQETHIAPGQDKFKGIWIYQNGSDTIRMQIVKLLLNVDPNGETKVSGLLVFYTYKQGSTIIWDNFSNAYPYATNPDFGANVPYGGVNRDTIEFMGRDELKRKTDEGYLVINAAQNQLSFKRAIGIGGGGLNIHRPGEAPLPGYTLPDNFTMIKQEPTSVEKHGKP